METMSINVCFVRKKERQHMLTANNANVVPRIGECVYMKSTDNWFLVDDVIWIVDNINNMITVEVICA